MPKAKQNPLLIGCIVVPFAVFAAVMLIAGISVFMDTQREKRVTPAERDRQRLTALAAIDKYTAALGRAYDGLSRTNFDGGGSSPCPADAMARASEQQPDAALGLPVLNGGFLKRFAHPDETWTADTTAWAFVNDAGLGSWFKTNPKSWSLYDLQQSSNMIHDYTLRRYVLVLWPQDEATNRVPQRTEANPDDPLVAGIHYTKGEFHGWLVTADTADGSIACWSRLDVVSSNEIHHNQNSPFPSPLHTRMVVYHPERDARNEIQRDFERRLSREIKHDVPAGVNVFMSFGPIF